MNNVLLKRRGQSARPNGRHSRAAASSGGDLERNQQPSRFLGQRRRGRVDERARGAARQGVRRRALEHPGSAIDQFANHVDQSQAFARCCQEERRQGRLGEDVRLGQLLKQQHTTHKYLSQISFSLINRKYLLLYYRKN
jgi:hypothetical protein